MSVFEMKEKKSETSKAGAQKVAEEVVKSSLSDESLGLSSE